MEGYGGAVVLCRPSHAMIKLSPYLQNRTSANTHVALEVGQLVKDDYFTLFESIGAIEVAYSCCWDRDRVLIQSTDHGP